MQAVFILIGVRQLEPYILLILTISSHCRIVVNENDEFMCFAATTAERFFRIDRALEQLHYVTDICNGDLFIVAPDSHTVSYLQQLIPSQPPDDLVASTSLVQSHSPGVTINGTTAEPLISSPQ